MTGRGARSRVLAPAMGVDDFHRAPDDRFVGARNGLVFRRPGLLGVMVWGTIDAQTVLELARIASFPESSPGQAEAPALLDLRFVDGFDPRMFGVRAELLAANRTLISRFVTRIAVVHPSGVIGATAIGMRAVSPPPCPEQFFEDAPEAMRWLDREAEIPLIDELDALRRQQLLVTPLLRRLRKLLRERPRPSLAQAARALGVSTRSLQRKLADAGSTYQEELAVATVHAGQALLLKRGASVTSVAMDLGCASPQHFSTMFRKVVGETPLGWRERQLRKTGE